MDLYEWMGVVDLTQLLGGVVRLVLAAVCGALIGLERERHRRPAGLRTHMLVCLGAALVMLTGQQIQIAYPGGDTARLGAQVISGIGFLGAGTIIIDRYDRVRGLTTAAGLWTSACIGLAVGAGYYLGGLLSCLLVLVIVAAVRKLENRLLTKSRLVDLYVECADDNGLHTFLAHLAVDGCQIISYRIVRQTDRGEPLPSTVAAAILTVKTPGAGESQAILQKAGGAAGLVAMKEI